MPPQRHSRRIRKEKVPSPGKAARVRKPSSHTIQAFDDKVLESAPPKKTAKRSKKRPKPKKAFTPSAEVEEIPDVADDTGSRDTMMGENTPVLAGRVETTPAVSSPPIASSPLAYRAKKTTIPVLVVFDASKPQNFPHPVEIKFAPYMRGRKMDLILHMVDINSGFEDDNGDNPFSATLADLQEVVKEECVDPYDASRNLEEYPVLLHWKCYIGSPKSSNAERYLLNTQKQWLQVCSALRGLMNLGAKAKKDMARSLYIECHYDTPNRENTPSQPTGSSKNKRASKEQAHTVRSTNLSRGEVIPISSDHLEAEDEISDGDTPSNKPKQERDSVTVRMKAQKKKLESLEDNVTKIGRKLFVLHQCNRHGCENFDSMCFFLKSAQTHHKVFPHDQLLWARHIANGVDHVDLDIPPAAMLLKYTDGWNLQIVKKSGKKKESELPVVAAPTTTTDKPFVIQNILPQAPAPQRLPPTRMPQQFRHYQPPYARYGRQTGERSSAGYNYPRPSSYHHHPLPPQPPVDRGHVLSSPYRGQAGEDIEATFEEWMLQGDVDPSRVANIKKVFALMRDNDVMTYQLKDAEVRGHLIAAGAPFGTVALLGKQVSVFAREKKGATGGGSDGASSSSMRPTHTDRPLRGAQPYPSFTDEEAWGEEDCDDDYFGAQETGY